MPEPLWKIRQRKGLSINQLASKSGVPAISIQEYESGRAIRSADLPKLAKALFVEEWDIEFHSEPRPKKRAARPAQEKKPPPARAVKPPPPPPPARPSQIEHLLNMVQSQFGKDRAAIEAEIGKTLEEMTQAEASELLSQYQKLVAESREPKSDEEPQAKRRRAYLPEGVDTFELQYLTTHQEAGTQLRFTLFDAKRISGRIIGFSPYSITIGEAETNDEITIQKLAVAYYRAVRNEEDES